MADIISAVLKQIFPAADDVKIEALRKAFNEGYTKFSLDTPLRRAHFFAQVLEEVGAGANARAENLDYAATALAGQFKYFQLHSAEATQFGRTAQHPADQVAIANRAYANRYGNGDVASGEGWKYRGKGYLQLTFKSNYNDIQLHMVTKLPDCGIDIVHNENDIMTVRGNAERHGILVEA